MGTHHSGRVPGHECPIDEMPPDSWKARRAHEALLKAQCAVLGAGAGAFPDRAEMLGQLARAAGRAGIGLAVEPVAEGAEVVAAVVVGQVRSEEHTSDLQQLMSITSAAFGLKKT